MQSLTRSLAKFLGVCLLGLALTFGMTMPLLAQTQAEATFAGGCFWCMEPPYDKLPGVISTTSGFMGGDVENPTYQQVTRGDTGHLEVVQVIYDPEAVDYETLLTTFWQNVDPLDSRGQFCDKGEQYRSAIFAHTPEQKELAIASQAEIAATLGEPIDTRILDADTFYAAEDYHQNFYQTNSIRYRAYRFACGRDQRLNELWGNS